MSTLKVRLREKREDEAAIPLVQDHERLEVGVNAFVGAQFEEHPKGSGKMAFVATGEDVELPERPEYLRALMSGDLLPADEATAKYAGLEAPKKSSRRQTTSEPQKEGT